MRPGHRAEGLGDADHDLGPAQHGADEPRRAARELEVGEAAGGAAPVEGEDEAGAGERRDRASREPVGVDEVGAARGPAERAEHRDGEQRRPPRPAPEVADDAAVVGEPEVPVDPGRDDVDVDAVGLEALDEILDEAAGEVGLVPRVGGGEVDDSRRAGGACGGLAGRGSRKRGSGSAHRPGYRHTDRGP